MVTLVTQEKYSKLLGMTVDDSWKRKTQVFGKGGLVSAQNQRLFMVKRLQNALNKEGIRKMAKSLFNSKLWYGLQLDGRRSKATNAICTPESSEKIFNGKMPVY